MFHPRDYLPTEMWECIGNKLKNPGDLNNLSNVSSYFFQLLEPKRPQFLFQLVIPIVGDYNPKYTVWGHYLSVKDLLNLRLANKSCNQSVVHYFQDHLPKKRPSYIDENYSVEGGHQQIQYSMEATHLNYSQRRIPMVINRLTYQQVGTWLDAAQLSHPPPGNANPILSRELKVSIFVTRQEAGLLQEILNTVTRLLQLYGRELLHCQFRFGRRIPREMEQQYNVLKEWLEFVPNLTSLQIYCTPSRSSRKRRNRHPEIQESHIEASPLPELRHLSQLKTENLPQLIQNAFFQRYGHVDTLHLSLIGRECRRFGPVQLESINTLKMKIRYYSELKALKRCLTPSWLQLQTLEMDFFTRENYGVIDHDYLPDWRDILGFLNRKFGNAERLVNLNLHMPSTYGPAVLEDTCSGRLKLAHVEELKLHVHNLFLLDFILPMRNSLKKLIVWNECMGSWSIDLPANEEVKLPGKIAWNGWLGWPLLSSNIWSNFPHLKFLRVENQGGWTYRRWQGTPYFVNRKGREESKAVYEEHILEEDLEESDYDSSEEESENEENENNN